jgi:hypothetical protein
MRPSFRHGAWMLSMACLLPGCILTVDEPFGDSSDVRSLKKLVGVWAFEAEENKTNVLLIQHDADGLRTGFASWNASPSTGGAGNQFALEQGQMQLRTVSGMSLLFHKPDREADRDVWSIARFEQTNENSFQIFLPDQPTTRKMFESATDFSLREIRQSGKPVELHVEGDLTAFAAKLDAETLRRCFPESHALRMRRLAVQP